jgi:hypothetical protein
VFAAEVEETLEAGTKAAPQPQRLAELTAGARLLRKLEAERLRQQRRPAALRHPRGHPKAVVCPLLARRAVLQQWLESVAAGLRQFSAPAGAEEQSAAEPAVAAREHVAHPGLAGADPVHPGLARGPRAGSAHSRKFPEQRPKSWLAHSESCWAMR